MSKNVKIPKDSANVASRMEVWFEETIRSILILLFAVFYWILTCTGPLVLLAALSGGSNLNFYWMTTRAVASILITVPLFPYLVVHSIVNLIIIGLRKQPIYDSGAFGAVKWMQRNGVYDPLYTDDKPDPPMLLSPLHRAIIDGNEKKVDKILASRKCSIFINSVCRLGLTPLHLAASSDNVSIIEKLLAHGASVNIMTKNYYTALTLAIECGHDNIVKILEQNGA